MNPVKNEVWIVPDEGGLARAAAGAFLRSAREAVEARGLFSVVLSGGSTPKSMYRLLASAETTDQVPWKSTYVFWSDERLVPSDDPESNYRMAKESLLQFVPIPPGQVHRIRTELGLADIVAEDYERQIQSFVGAVGQNSRRLPFDLTFLGMGEDGHTASLFPGVPTPNPDPGEDGRWVLSRQVPSLNTYRISMSPLAINSSRQIIFLVAGERKAQTLKKVLEGPLDPTRLPAQQIHAYEGNVLWIVDKQAGSLLSRKAAA